MTTYETWKSLYKQLQKKYEFRDGQKITIIIFDDEVNTVAKSIERGFPKEFFDFTIIPSRQSLNKTISKIEKDIEYQYLIIADADVEDSAGDYGFEIARKVISANNLEIRIIPISGKEKISLKQIEEKNKEYPCFSMPPLDKDDDFFEKLEQRVQDELKRLINPTEEQAISSMKNNYKDNEIGDDEELTSGELSFQNTVGAYDKEEKLTVGSLFKTWQEGIDFDDDVKKENAKSAKRILKEELERRISIKYYSNDKTN